MSAREMVLGVAAASSWVKVVVWCSVALCAQMAGAS